MRIGQWRLVRIDELVIKDGQIDRLRRSCDDAEKRLGIRAHKIETLREELKSLRDAAIGSCEHCGIGADDGAQD